MRLCRTSPCILLIILLLLGRTAYCREAPPGSYYYPPSPSKEGFTSQPWNDKPTLSSYFYILTTEGTNGPYSIQELSDLAEKGVIEPETRVQREEDGEIRTLGGLLEKYWSRFAHDGNKGDEIISDVDDFGGVKDVEGGRFVESVAAVRSGLGSFFRLKDTKQNLLQHLAPQQQQHGAMSPISRQGFKGRQEHQPNKAEWLNSYSSAHNLPHNHHLPQQRQNDPSTSFHSSESAQESPTFGRASQPLISAMNRPGQQQQHHPQRAFSQQQEIYEKLYPPPSTLPPPSVATRGERDMVGNVGFDKFHQPRSSGTAIDQNECFERHKRIAYGRQGGFERDEGIDSSSGVITTLKNNKPSIGCSEQVYIPAEPWNSERGRRAADKNKVSSSREAFSVFRVVGMHWHILRLTCQGCGFGGVMACLLLAITKACITLGLATNGIGMIDMMSKFQHDGNDLFQRGTEYAAALLTVSYMAKLAVDGLSHVALFRVGRQSVLQNSQTLLLSSGSDLGRDAFSHSLLAPWQYIRNVLQFMESGMTLLGSIILLELVWKGSWMACTTVVGLLLTAQLMKTSSIFTTDTPMALLLSIIEIGGGNPSEIIMRSKHRLRNMASLLLRVFCGFLSWGILSMTLGFSLFFAIQELSDGLVIRERALYFVGFAFLAQHNLRSSIQALNSIREAFPIARRVILHLHEKRVSRQGFIEPNEESSN